jgi:hypothetical protein
MDTEADQPCGGMPQFSGQYPGQPPIIAATGTRGSRVRPGRIVRLTRTRRARAQGY